QIRVEGGWGQTDRLFAQLPDWYRVHARQAVIRPHCKGYFFASDGSRRDAIGSTARQQCECGVGGVVLNQLQVRSRRSGNGLDLDSRKAPAILRDDRTGCEHIAGCVRWRRSAARPKWPRVATSTNALSCRSSIVRLDYAAEKMVVAL